MQQATGTSRWVRGTLALVRAVGVALVVWAALMFVVQRRFAFSGTALESPRASASAPEGVIQVWLGASFGDVEAWFFGASERATAPTVVFAHGNAELIEDWQNEMERLAASGMNALLIEFPGYGHSEGKPSREALRETFGLGYDWLVAEGEVADDRIIAYGRSIGGGAASDLSRDRPVRALALQSTFSSATRMARQLFVPGFLVLDRFDNARAVADFQGPVLLMHGVADDVIPYAHAETLASVRAGLDIIEIGCAHNDCAGEWPSIVETLAAFLRTNGLL